MLSTDKIYITASELAESLGISIGQAYKILRMLNSELEEKGYLTISGKCPRRYFEKKWYGYEDETSSKGEVAFESGKRP